ncbi:molybdopterin molybdotransferase MoeA [Terracidiphilus gabretensis]|uniref:molybdopterin molybdotransferase MoeA n=1 Tax=Terracidiphilus gabretensis TaxID=1577687 RepID=UPI00071B58B2|nr:gephyrin-like molybdotransferase Glp [Terracidiphilus gabretensis]
MSSALASLPSYEEAAAIVSARAAELACVAQTERVGLHEAAGRILAVPIRTDHEMPPFARSTRDGYAVRAEDANRYEWMEVAGSTRTGDAPAPESLIKGTAWEIMTGAAVPPGADAVAMLEHVEAEADVIRLVSPRKLEVGENIVLAGAEARTGDEIVPAGTWMGAAQIGAAAACGYAELEVFCKPRVMILTTGDELVAVTEKPGPGQIRNSNAPMLTALVEQFGGHAVTMPAIGDSAEALDKALYVTAAADMVIFSGGISAGRFDLVEPALERLGAKFHFTGARIQPGKPVVFGEIPRGDVSQPVFGLPGNPISSTATFLLFAAPVLAALAGRRGSLPRWVLAHLERGVKGNPGLTRFVPAHCEAGGGVQSVETHGSGDIAAFARANCFLMVPESAKWLEAGEMVRTLQF